MALNGSDLSRGPALEPNQKGVHIIFVPLDTVTCVSPSHPTDAELAQVALHIGQPTETDVIVFAGQPWHFAEGKLRKHPEVHKLFRDTILTLYKSKRDTAVWWSEKEFMITGIDKEDPKKNFTADYPFGAKPDAERKTIDGKPVWVAKSTVPVDTAYGQEYKITFEMGGQRIDPNMDCNGG
jgi:hypothetical protein